MQYGLGVQFKGKGDRGGSMRDMQGQLVAVPSKIDNVFPPGTVCVCSRGYDANGNICYLLAQVNQLFQYEHAVFTVHTFLVQNASLKQ